MAVFPIYKYKSTQSRSVGAVLPLSLRVILEPARFDCSQCHTKLFSKHKFLWTKRQFYPLLECFNLKGSEHSGAKRKGLGVPWGRPASLQTSFQRIQFQETGNNTGNENNFSSRSTIWISVKTDIHNTDFIHDWYTPCIWTETNGPIRLQPHRNLIWKL